MDLTLYRFCHSCCLALSLLMAAAVKGQDDFFDEISCYSCIDVAENSTCANPGVEPPVGEDVGFLLPSVTCEKGACIKWTYYKNHKLMIHRTCSEKMSIHIHLVDVCRTERNDNGYLCMCSRNFCNSATLTRGPSLPACILLALIFSVARTVSLT